MRTDISQAAETDSFAPSTSSSDRSVYNTESLTGDIDYTPERSSIGGYLQAGRAASKNKKKGSRRESLKKKGVFF